MLLNYGVVYLRMTDSNENDHTILNLWPQSPKLPHQTFAHTLVGTLRCSVSHSLKSRRWHSASIAVLVHFCIYGSRAHDMKMLLQLFMVLSTSPFMLYWQPFTTTLSACTLWQGTQNALYNAHNIIIWHTLNGNSINSYPGGDGSSE